MLIKIISLVRYEFLLPLQCFYLLNCKIWGTLQYKTNIRDNHEQEGSIVDERDKLDQRIIDEVVGEWRKRL